jgi:phosphonate transport system substrate-binding protein
MGHRTCAGFVLAIMVLLGASGAPAADKVVIGIIPEQNLVKQMERFVPICDYLERKLGLEVDVKPLSRYGQIFEEMRDGRIDAGFFGSFVFAMTRAKLGIEPLVRPQRLDGGSTYTAMTFVRKDSGIRKSADMKGKTIALADPATTAGYLVQKEYLRTQGLDLDKDLKILWTGSHDAAIRAVLNHQADIGGAKSLAVKRARKENRVFDTLVNVVHEGPKRGVPDNTFAVRKGIEPGVRERMKRVFTEMHNDPEGRRVLEKFGATRFVETRTDDFAPVYDMVRHLKIDLASYPYNNR